MAQTTHITNPPQKSSINQSAQLQPLSVGPKQPQTSCSKVQSSWSISHPPQQAAQPQIFIPEQNYYQPPQLHQATQNLRHAPTGQPSQHVIQPHSFWLQQSSTGQPPQQATQPQNHGSQLSLSEYPPLSLASDKQSKHHWDDTHTSNSRPYIEMFR